MGSFSSCFSQLLRLMQHADGNDRINDCVCVCVCVCVGVREVSTAAVMNEALCATN